MVTEGTRSSVSFWKYLTCQKVVNKTWILFEKAKDNTSVNLGILILLLITRDPVNTQHINFRVGAFWHKPFQWYTMKSYSPKVKWHGSVFKKVYGLVHSFCNLYLLWHNTIRGLERQILIMTLTAIRVEWVQIITIYSLLAISACMTMSMIKSGM